MKSVEDYKYCDLCGKPMKIEKQPIRYCSKTGKPVNKKPTSITLVCRRLFCLGTTHTIHLAEQEGRVKW